MRTIIIIIVAIIAIAIFAGWLKFYRNGENATIEIDGTEFRSDADHVLQESKNLIDKGKESIDADSSPQTITP